MSEGKTRQQQRVRRVQATRAAAERPYVDIELTLEYGAYGPRSKAVPGEEWRASWYDRARNEWPAGSGSTPWEAIGWAIVDAIAIRAGHLIIAIDSRDTPQSYLAKLERTIGAAS